MDRSFEITLKNQIRQDIVNAMAALPENTGDAELRALVVNAVHSASARIPESGDIDLDDLCAQLIDDYLNYGPLQPLLEDDRISEIMVNGGGIDERGRKLPPRVFVEVDGHIYPSPATAFDDDEHVMRIIGRIAQEVSRSCNEAHPLMDARLKDGSRVNASHGCVSIDGPSLNIRRFRTDAMEPGQLVERGLCTPDMMAFLESCVKARLNIVVSGGTGSGKTTLLNALAHFIPKGERIVTIEDSAELKLQHANLVRMEARSDNAEGKGRVSIHDLVVNALRQRPDRIIVGECRSDETIEMLQAMQTGHDGSLTTIHANSPLGVFSRIETMVVSAQPALSIEAVDRQIAEAIDVIVHLFRDADGTRRIGSIMSIEGFSDGSIVHSELFAYERHAYQHEAGHGRDGESAREHPGGSFVPQGMQPRLIRERIAYAGAPYDPSWFTGEGR